jgi:hypothetical protein
MSSLFSFNPCAISNSSSYNIMPDNSVGDDWKLWAQELLFDDNNNTANPIDIFCEAWVGGTADNTVGVTATPAAIWNHALTKTVGWTIVMLLKSIFLERKLDRWSGTYRFLNLGSTLLPFAMALWTIADAMILAGGGDSADDPLSSTATLKALGSHVARMPAVRNWALTGLAWFLVRTLVIGKLRSSRMVTTIEWIPGILAGTLSLACKVTDDTTIAGLLLGAGEEELPPGTLLLCGTLLRWVVNTITGWYCYAWMVRMAFGTTLFTSFPCFLLVFGAGRIATLGHVF